MALKKDAFQNYLAQWQDDVQSLVQGVDTWAGNKADANATFDFSTAKTDLDAAKAALETSVSTVVAL